MVQKEVREERTKEEYTRKIPISISITLCDEAFFGGDYTPIELAKEVTHGTRKDLNLWRKYLRNGSIEESDFLYELHTLWREIVAGEEPPKRAKAFQSRINPRLKGRKPQA